jgi:4-oxalocrotonate tautomerase family enzyme
MAAGRTTEEKTKLMKAVTDAIYDTVDVPLSAVHVMIQEIPAEDIMVAGQLLSRKDKKSRL